MYKAVTTKGVIVRNRVEASSRLSLIKSLKNNNLIPISIEQLAYRSNQQKKKKNVTDTNYKRKN